MICSVKRFSEMYETVYRDQEVVKTFPVMASELEQIGEELGVKIQAQHQEIFEMMHRI